MQALGKQFLADAGWPCDQDGSIAALGRNSATDNGGRHGWRGAYDVLKLVPGCLRVRVPMRSEPVKGPLDACRLAERQYRANAHIPFVQRRSVNDYRASVDLLNGAAVMLAI